MQRSQRMRILILGLGISGRAAAELLLSRGDAVTGVDKSTELLSSHPDIQRLKERGLVAIHDSAMLNVREFDLFVPSPGVSPLHPLYAKAEKEGVKIIGEAALALAGMKQPALGITGSNGKTTVTLLVTHVLNQSGKKAKALGNVGEPLSTYFVHPDLEEIIVTELSSFQLETMGERVFSGGMILNITPNHLDRYSSMEAYAQAKCRLQWCIKRGAPLFVHEHALREFGSFLDRKNLFTFGMNPTCDFWTDKCKIYAKSEPVEYLLPARYRELSEHESENALAAWLLVRLMGVPFDRFVQALESFCKPPHRIEFVKKIGGVSYFDDSKGTSLDATMKAVQAMRGPVILIAGGVDKGASYTPWVPLFQGRVKKILVLGQAAPKMVRELGGAFLVEMVDSLGEAVATAHHEATQGDCVLLSPGCSSYDMFRDYAHRGEEFKRCVNELVFKEE